MRSARRWIGAREPWASSTSRTIWASTVSRPTRVASMRNEPVVLIVAPTTSSPGPLSTGSGSPVSIASSTAEAPSTTRPSTGIFSPGRTTSRSPTRISSTGTSISPPSRSTRAVRAPISSRRRIADDVRPMALASNTLPSSTRARIQATAS